MRKAFAICSALLFAGLASGPVLGQGSTLELRYGPEQTVFGSCKPSLTLVNRSGRALDYVQVDVDYRFRDGRAALAEHKSRYRTGFASPIGPGEQRLLNIHHDESVPLGAACSEIVAARIVAAECNGDAPGSCQVLAPPVGGDLALPAR